MATVVVQRGPSLVLVLLLLVSFSFFLLRPADGSHTRTAAIKHYVSRLGIYGSKSTTLRADQAFVERDGLLYLAEPARPQANAYNKVEHPILHLVREAQREWDEKVAGQSQNLEQAVATYRTRYGRAPPKGFDKWFQFARDNKVILVDNYDQINRDILPFLGLPSQPVHDRSRKMIEDRSSFHYRNSYTILIKDGRVSEVVGAQRKDGRTGQHIDLIANFVHMLPDMNVTITNHDGALTGIPGEKRLELEKHAREGTTLPKSKWNEVGDQREFVGWQSFCTPGSNMRNALGGLQPRRNIPDPSFVTNNYESIDFCRHPENLRLHGITNNHGLGPWPSQLMPIFAQSKSSLHADLLVTPMSQYGQPVGPDPEWAAKPLNRILWRGGCTGGKLNRNSPWRSSQRVRFALLTNSKSDDITTTVYTTSRQDNSTLTAYDATLSELNPEWFDVQFAGKFWGCDKKDGTCDALARHLPLTQEYMSTEEANMYKYIFDVDGNGWSGRFHRLLRSKSAILKSTATVEWWNDRIQPWVHYIPVKVDYTDLHSIASFFVGDRRSAGHDELGQQIGMAGKKWAEKHWRVQDMEAYMFRLYLEFARVWHRDPDDLHSMDFVL